MSTSPLICPTTWAGSYGAPAGRLPCARLQLIVSPRTLLRRHADLVRRWWTYPRSTPGRPATAQAVRALVVQMARNARHAWLRSTMARIGADTDRSPAASG